MNEFEDYRYVLSLWGCLCGYMEMDKESLADILNMSTYSKVYEKLYGKSMGRLSQEFANKSPKNSKVGGRCQFSKENLSFILNAVKFKEGTLLIDRITSLSKPLNECFEEAIEETLSKRATKQRKLAILALEIYQSTEDYDTLRTVLETAKLSKSVQKSILEEFGYSKGKNEKSKAIEVNSRSLFSEGNEQSSVKIQSIKQLPDIPSFAEFGENVRRRLKQNWSFTELKYPNDKKEQIRFFINLCKKEGKYGNANGATSLTSVFTENIAYQAEKELLKYYGI